MTYAEVIVVGAGPAGLTCAGDLARAGRSVIVLERRPEPTPSSRAFATMARTLELLDSRGVADDLVTLGARTPQVHLFGGAALDLRHLPSRYPFALITPQTNVDRVLQEYAVGHGADVRRGAEVVGLDQDDNGVTVTVVPKDGGPEATLRAAYAIGADGAHSTVRRLLGIDFPGREVLSSMVLADVRLTHGPEGDGLRLGNTPRVFGFLVPYGPSLADGSRWFRSMTWDRDHQVSDHTPILNGEVARVLTKAMGSDQGVAEIGWQSRFHCEERQVRNYRHGRVLLVGDAAHVHSPMGGQGMNTGIQDAVNLGWKLDLVLGGAPRGVLDTYQRERHPIGRRVLRQSGAVMRAVTLRPPAARWLRDHLAPWVLHRSRIRDVIAGSFAGTGLRYTHRRNEHHLVGTRATEVPLTAQSLTFVQRTAGFVLIREQGASQIRTNLAQAERRDGGPALLVRPDGHIAWAGPSIRQTGWRDTFHAWTGNWPTP